MSIFYAFFIIFKKEINFQLVVQFQAEHPLVQLRI